MGTILGSKLGEADYEAVRKAVGDVVATKVEAGGSVTATKAKEMANAVFAARNSVNEEINRLLARKAVLGVDRVDLSSGGSQTITVKLGTAPTANVVVTIASRNTDIASVSPGTLTFSSSNWNATQNLTITAGSSGAGQTEVTFTTASTGGYDGSVESLPVFVL